MQDMGDSSLLYQGGIITKEEEKDESDLASYAASHMGTHELMSSSTLGLSLHDGGDDEDLDKDSPFSSTQSFQDSLADGIKLPGSLDGQQENAIPRLMQMQMEKYGTSYFQRNESGYYTCFFVGCGKKLQANFSRHIAKHEQDGDSVDPNLAQNMKATAPAGPPMQTCSHPFHMAWWHTRNQIDIETLAKFIVATDTKQEGDLKHKIEVDLFAQR